MKKRTVNDVEVRRGSGNLFADLDVPNAEKLKGPVIEIRQAVKRA